jgi:peptide-methionine (R)-S-oxide reductase
MDKIIKTEDEWKKDLTPQAYHVLREKGTEIPFSGKYDKAFEQGMYTCGACGNQIFDSGRKYDAHCGWPSFDEAIPGSVEFHEDNTLGMKRIEVTCARCGSHLGHVFPDGPKETTGQRFCINSGALGFSAKGGPASGWKKDK